MDCLDAVRPLPRNLLLHSPDPFQTASHISTTPDKELLMRNFTIVNPFPPSYIRAQRDLRRALPLLAAVILAALAATLNAAGPPSAPTGFRLVAREARLGVVWRAPDQPNGVISRYVVEYRQGDTGGWTALHITPGGNCDQQNRCSTEISGLTGGQLYQVRVAADNGQVGAYAGPESAAPLAANPPPTATPTPTATSTLPPTATPTPVGEDTAGPSPTPLPPTAAPTQPPAATPAPTATPPPTARQVAVNRPPTASAGAAQTVEEGTAVTLNGSASSDPDGDKLTYAWLQLSGTTVSLSSATAASPTFMAPQLLQNEALVFQLIVNDGAASSAPATVTVTVEADNDAPTLGVSAAHTVAAGETVTLSGLATDPEGQTVTWLWSQTGATPAVTLHNAKTATASFTAPANLAADATLTFMLTVSDGVNTATATVQVIVRKTAAPAAASQQAAGQQAVSPGLRLSTASLTVDEGGSRSFTVRLNTEPPPGFVVINIHLNPGGVLRLQSARQLVFAPTNWNHEWTVTVEALPDVDGDENTATISFSVDSSSTAAYRIVDIPDVDVTVNDTGPATAAVIVNPTTLSVQEGSFAGYTLVLGARPSRDVTINISESSPAIVTSPNSNPDSGEPLTEVTFTPENWHKPQVVFVNGLQDDENALDETPTITHTVKKPDSAPEYADDSVSVSAVNVTVEDNDKPDGTPGVSFVSARPPILVCEPSPYDSPNSPPCLGYYEIVLDKKPTTRVVIRITSGDPDRVQVSTDTDTTWSNTVDMTFTPKNWNVDWKHGVYLKGLADDDCDSETVTITHAVVDDPKYPKSDARIETDPTYTGITKILTAETYDSDSDCSG